MRLPGVGWLLPIWRGDLGVAGSTLLLSGLGATLLGTLADGGMEMGLAARGPALGLFAVSALFLAGFAVLSLVAVWHAARRKPGLGAGIAVAFAALQSALMAGDVGLSTSAVFGLGPSPLQLLKMMTLRAIALPVH